MSINFIKNQLKLVEKKNTKKSTICNSDEKYNKIILHFIKMFDNHYINYISYRKQRDLIIVNCFYKFLIKNTKFDKKSIKKYEISEFFDLKNDKIDINNEVLPINNREIILNLEQEISILKTFEIFFNKTLFNQQYCNYHNNKKQNIDMKIKKIIDLTDKKTLYRLTRNSTIQQQILEEIGVICEYDKIAENFILLSNLQNELKLVI